ncbi:hypothetical protein KUCAC02_017882, partial [Chaenocephalus aceratus]
AGVFSCKVPLELANLLGCTYFDKLDIGYKTNYRSHRIIDEMLEILATVIEQPIVRAIAQSKAIGIEIEETTDISVCRQMDIHVRYLDQEGKLSSQFLDLMGKQIQ